MMKTPRALTAYAFLAAACAAPGKSVEARAAIQDERERVEEVLSPPEEPVSAPEPVPEPETDQAPPPAEDHP